MPDCAPVPPTSIWITDSRRSPVRGSCSAMTTGTLVPPDGAGIRPGKAVVSTPTSVSLTRTAVAWRTPTAAGKSGLSTVPRGTPTVMFSNSP
jgi:hypothetical protein